MTIDISRYDPVWRAAEPYLRARKTDVHIPLSFGWAVKLVEQYPAADPDVCLLAILLHDIGWYSIDMERIVNEGFRGDNVLVNDVRFLHETEGVRLGTGVLRQTGWSEAAIAQVCEIIDGHDTRAEPRHLNDRIVRDADKLWRYSVTGTAVGCDWFGETPHQNWDRNQRLLPKFETEAGRAMAEAEQSATARALRLDVL